jgi:uncharacterized membrane protein
MKTKLFETFFLGNTIRRFFASWLLSSLVLLMKNKEDFLSKNFLQQGDMAISIIVLLISFVVLSLLAYAVRGIQTDSLALLIVSLTISWLWISKTNGVNEKNWLLCLTLIAAIALVLRDFLSQNENLFTKINFSEKTAFGLIFVCGTVCALFIGIVTCLRYISFSSPTFDFGIFVQMFHNMSETLVPETTCERNELLSHFAIHLSPIFYVLLPFYWLFPSPLTLQIAQALVVASGLIPLVLIMKKHAFSTRARVAFAAVYMFFPIISRGCFYDIHENCFLLPLLLWIFWAYEKESIPFVCIFTVLCFMVKEDAAVYVALFALYAIFAGETKKRKLLGAGMLAAAIAYFLFATWYINAFGEGIMSGRYDNCSTDGSLLGVIQTAISNPGLLISQLTVKGWNSVLYILAFLVPLGFLPLMSKKMGRYLLLIPIVLNLLTDWQYQLELIYQYHFGISAFMLYAAILNYRDLSKSLQKYFLALALSAGMLLHAYLVLPETVYRIEYYQNSRTVYREMVKVLEVVPDDVSVAANSYLLPHLADRKEIYSYREKPEHKTDFIVLDMRNATDREAYQNYVTNGYRPYIEDDRYIAILVDIYWTENK